MSIILIVPSLKISGGNNEALRMVNSLQHKEVFVVSMWRASYPIKSSAPVVYLSNWSPNVFRALVDLVPLTFFFARWLSDFDRKGQEKPKKFIFTHYSTLPLAFLVPKISRYFFVQGVEWHFTNNPLLSLLLKWIILTVYRSGQIITANKFLTGQMEVAGLKVSGEMPIWASGAFKSFANRYRDIDYVMVLRKGQVKRLDLYKDFITRALTKKRRIAIITPEDEVAVEFASLSLILLRPTADEMCDLYARSRCFIHLSDHEGFGLPPLEAMGAGCVPICRDSGGIRAYLNSEFTSNLIIQKKLRPSQFFAEAESILSNANLLERYSKEVQRIFVEGLIESENNRLRLALALR